MSRNFELLQQVAGHDLLTATNMVLPLQEEAAAPADKPEPANDDIRKLVQRLFFPDAQVSGPKVVSFAGMDTSGRSSWICARSAEFLASQVAGSVCVMDADVWSPQLHGHFMARNLAGLSAALGSDGPVRGFATRLSSDNLWLMPAGTRGIDPCTQVQRFQSRLAELRKEFNYVLISTPALSHEAEATLVGQLSDGIVLIVEANATKRESIRRVREHLDIARVKLLGAVLDQRSFPIPEFLYRRL